MDKNILYGIISLLIIAGLAGIAVTIWKRNDSNKSNQTEHYWPQTEYAYTYVNNGIESDKSPITTLGLKTDSSKNPTFTVRPLGYYTIKMYRRISGQDWELLGEIPAGSTTYKDTKTPPDPPIPPPNCLESGNPFGHGGTCAKPCCKNTCFKNGTYFCSNDDCPSDVPKPTCCPNCGECNDALCKDIPPTPPVTNYTFNYDTTDNHLGIKVDQTKDNYFMVLGDWGAGTDTGCLLAQQAVAYRMLKYYNDNKATKNLLFILTLGDNFYWTGMDRDAMLRLRWKDTYGDLCNYKWLAGMGNHDWGDNDPSCVCPSNNPYLKIGDQGYQCNQLNANKGGYRPDGTENYYMPDFGYHYTIKDLDLEIIVTPQSGDGQCEEIGGSGGDGRKQVESNCGGYDNMCNKLKLLSEKGQELIESRAHAKESKNVVIAQHYDGLDSQMYDLFTKINPTAKVISAAGHVHNTTCAKNDGNLCTHMISGGGGGCCKGHPACNADGSPGPGAGFFVVNIDANKNMTTEQVMVNSSNSNDWGWEHI